MNDNRKKNGSNKKKLLPVISIIIVVIIILTFFYIWYEINIGTDKNNIDDSEKFNVLELTVNMEDIIQDENISINWQLKNVGDNDVDCTVPELGKNLYFYIKAKNGTVYTYVGPVNTGLLLPTRLPSGEVINGTVHKNYFGILSSYTDENYSNWQNSTTEEYWFFQPETYEIYGEYRSFVDILGVLYSDTTTFRIE